MYQKNKTMKIYYELLIFSPIQSMYVHHKQVIISSNKYENKEMEKEKENNKQNEEEVIYLSTL